MAKTSASRLSSIFQKYFDDIRAIHLQGNYTEMTFRTAFENFIEGLNPDYDLFQEPEKQRKLGAPDFRANRKSVRIGYIETKDLGKNLDEELGNEQMKKYTESIGNIILTNYSRSVSLRNGQKIDDLSLFTTSDLDNPKFSIPENAVERFLETIGAFFDYSLPTITSAESLAEELSKKAKLLRDLAEQRLEEDAIKARNSEPTSSVYDFYQGIEQLVKDLTLRDCADAYAQTIAYGLFLARIGSTTRLERNSAASYIPRSIAVIKRIFLNISGDSLPSELSWIIDDIIDVLNAADMQSVLSDVDPRTKKDRDPFSYFYENFLTSYDPEKRKHMGVYYTPRPVVNFIVNSVNLLLKNAFHKIRGIAEDDVTVLDPAAGTGTFLWMAFLVTFKELKNSKLGGLIPNKIQYHLLQDFYGFEILIAPYIFSHLKLTSGLQRWGYNLKENERVRVYYTNTLDPAETQTLLPFMKELTEESKVANDVKVNRNILVVLGNPPYSVSSSNKSKWIMEKMQDYKAGLKERNIQPLDDDYIKFVRLAQWKIEQNKQGIIGLITNNSYLDGIIHRQMRNELLKTFDQIFILNLHGDSRKQETTPEGTKDENVFDIQQGVAISIFVKNPSSKVNQKRILYFDVYGLREQKFEWLDKNDVSSVKWKTLEPGPPFTSSNLKRADQSTKASFQ